MKTLLRLPALMLAFCVFSSAESRAGERLLRKQDAEREEVRHSMIGPRDTLLFHTFPKRQAVLRLTIGNSDDSFPVTGRVFLFPPETPAEELAKWVNNQHSDGLYPEVPEPVGSFDLPKDACVVTGKKLIGEKRHEPLGKIFREYRITFTVAGHKVGEHFELQAFEDQAGVFVKVTEG